MLIEGVQLRKYMNKYVKLKLKIFYDPLKTENLI